jgi:hypothetical protein
MAEVTLHPDAGLFPIGTHVKVYLASAPERGGPRVGAPPGVALSEPEVVSAGTLTVTGLEEAAEYIGWAVVGGVDHYLRFQTGGTEGGIAFVGEDGTVGGAGGSSLSSKVVTSKLKTHGEVEGALTPSYAEGSAVLATMKGALTFEKPTGWPTVPAWMDVTLTQDAIGHVLKMGAGITMPGGEPLWSSLALAVNQFSLWSPDGGTTVYLFTGPEGKQGVKGTTGATGETVGSTEAALKMTYPALNGNPKATGTKAATAWRLQRNLVVIPVKCKKLKIVWTPGTIKGKVRVIVFDTGQKVAGKYSVLADTKTFVNPGTEKVAGVLAELERSEGEWAPGEVVMIGVIAESAEMILPISTEPSVGASCKFPAGAVPNGVALTTAWICDQVVLTEAAAKAEPLAAIAEEAPVGPALTVAYAVMCA